MTTSRSHPVQAAAPLAAVCLPLVLLASCAPSTSTAIPYTDNFDRVELGENWLDNMGGQWHIKDGRLHNTGAQNAPLWLRAKLPDDVVIEFDAWTDPKICDIKFEVFADGRTHATGYILLLGAWKNSTSAIARLDEHEKGLPKKRSDCVPGKKYHWKVERKGSVLSWHLDGQPYMQRNDPNPLKGKGHDRFAFNNWMSDVYYDNLSIRELK